MAVNIKRYFSLTRFIFRSFKKYIGAFALMIVLGLVSGGFESIGIASVIPLFYLVTGQPELQGTERISSMVHWVFSALHLPLTPVVLLLFIAGLFILKAIVRIGTSYLSTQTIAQFEERIRAVLFRRTMNTAWPFIAKQKLGYLEGILLYDIERSSALLAVISNIITIGTTLLMYIVVAISISGRVTVIAVVLGSAIFTCFKPLFVRIRKLVTSTASLQKDLNHHVAEHMLSAKSVKALAVERPVVSRAQQIFAELRFAKVRTALFRHMTLAVIEPLGFLLIAGLFMYSHNRPGFAFASFAVVMYLVNQMFNYLQSIQGQFHLVNELIPYLRTIAKYRREVAQNQETKVGTHRFSYKKHLIFEDVSFAYDPNRPILKEVRFIVNRGEHASIVGPSGVGKTTLVDLLLRLYNPQSGRILVDDIDISEFRLHSWRRPIGYVPQVGFLLNASVRDNIKFYDQRVSELDIVDAARAANIYYDIMALPEGFNTTTGERGLQLSGGQRQRIVLARALARHPSILILDEATSSIDGESEALIQKSISDLHGHITVIAITHRITSAMGADHMIVMENGQIVEDGTPQELAANPSSYVARLLKAAGIY